MAEKRFPCKPGKDGSGADHHRSTHPMELPPELRERLRGHRRESIPGGYIAQIERCFGALNDHNFYLKRHSSRRRALNLKERDALIWLGASLPVAEVEMYVETDRYDYLLITEMWGLKFNEYARRVDESTVIETLAQALKRFHSVKVEPRFNESIDSKLKRARWNITHKRLRKDIYYPGGPRKPNADLARLMGEMPTAEDSALTHGDFHLNNLLFDENGVCAYLDLAEAGLSDPYQDFATLAISLEHCVGDVNIAGTILREILKLYGIAEVDDAKLGYFRLLNEML